MAAKRNTTPKAATTATTPTKSTSTISKDGVITCAGACGESLPETKFPTKRNREGVYVRHDECRACQAARRESTRAAEAKA